jgi:hypothetical protein
MALKSLNINHFYRKNFHFYLLQKNDLAYFCRFKKTGLTSFEQMTFWCRAVDILEKCVEQSRFEQMDFEQLTPSPFKDNNKSFILSQMNITKKLFFLTAMVGIRESFCISTLLI